jgi:hypothetical protein
MAAFLHEMRYKCVTEGIDWGHHKTFKNLYRNERIRARRRSGFRRWTSGVVHILFSIVPAEQASDETNKQKKHYQIETCQAIP